MGLVFFQDAVDHIASIARVLRQPRGNALLVGVSGSGKQSLTRFAAALGGFTCVQLELTKAYSLTDFREDLKVCRPLPCLFSKWIAIKGSIWVNQTWLGRLLLSNAVMLPCGVLAKPGSCMCRHAQGACADQNCLH